MATHRFHRANRMPWPSWQDLYKAFTACKGEDYPFVTEVASRVAEGAFMDFGKAMANWRNTGLKARAPRFIKRKITGTGSFRAASDVAQIRYNGKRRVTLPIIGPLKLDHTLPQGIIHEAHIRRENGRWYLSIKMRKQPKAAPVTDTRTQGAVETGLNPHATDSDGNTYQNPKPYYQMERRLRRWQRAQARRTIRSRGWGEAQRRIDKCYRRIRGLRQNALHQITRDLVNRYSMLVVEDLNVAGMMKGPTLKAQADSAMGEIRRQLEYKAKWHHTEFKVASRFFPSSKLCSNCLHRNAKLKRERCWTCPQCGILHERNLNAAINLRNLLPPGRGPTLRDGKALASGYPAGETSPNGRRTAPQVLREL